MLGRSMFKQVDTFVDVSRYRRLSSSSFILRLLDVTSSTNCTRSFSNSYTTNTFTSINEIKLGPFDFWSERTRWAATETLRDMSSCRFQGDFCCRIDTDAWRKRVLSLCGICYLRMWVLTDFSVTMTRLRSWSSRPFMVTVKSMMAVRAEISGV